MRHSHRFLRLGTAVVLGLAATILAAGAALAHPESEGAHPSGCVVTVEPGSVGIGGQFTVAGNFGGASIFLLEGPNASPPEGGTPIATTPPGSSFSITFIAEAADVGEWTVWGLQPDTECADADGMIVRPEAAPNTAMPAPLPVVALGWLTLGLGLAMGIHRGTRPRIAG